MGDLLGAGQHERCQYDAVYFARKVGKYFLQITATDVSGIGQAAFEKMFTVPSAETGTAS